MIQLTLLLIFINIILSQNSEAKNLTEIVQTDRGPVQGEILTTVQNSSIQYSAFRGIPYAKPPIDELRYQVRVDTRNEIQNEKYLKLKIHLSASCRS